MHGMGFRLIHGLNNKKINSILNSRIGALFFCAVNVVMCNIDNTHFSNIGDALALNSMCQVEFIFMFYNSLD